MNMFLAVHNHNSAISSESNVVIKSRAILKQFTKNKYSDKECRRNIHSHVFQIFTSPVIGLDKKGMLREEKQFDYKSVNVFIVHLKD